MGFVGGNRLEGEVGGDLVGKGQYGLKGDENVPSNEMIWNHISERLAFVTSRSEGRTRDVQA